jgi:Alw26I/Eco31I/Esp3I family type II restriction m6 adenine DNA methyltransferase
MNAHADPAVAAAKPASDADVLRRSPRPGVGETIDRHFLAAAQRVYDREARKLRQEIAAEGSRSFVANYDPAAAASIVSKSPFAGYVRDYPHDNSLGLFAFNLDVTSRAVERLISSETEPVALAFTSSRVVELGLHSLYDPWRRDPTPRLFLGASKARGYFFTPPDVAFWLAAGAVADTDDGLAVFDPAVGAGALLAAAMITAQAEGLNLERVVGIELDAYTADICSALLCKLRDLVDMPDLAVNVYIDDAISKMYEWAQNPVGARFDCIVMNPPYGRAKFLTPIITNRETFLTNDEATVAALGARRKSEAARQATRFREISAFLGLGGGAQDYQRLFIGLAMAVSSARGRLAVISPDAWLGDASATNLRRKMMDARLIEQITLYGEDAGLFATVNQPTAAVVLSRAPKESFHVFSSRGRGREVRDEYELAFADVEALDPERIRIPRISRELRGVYRKLTSHPRLRDLEHVKNARGELDLTLQRELVQSSPSKLRLVRGDHVERWILRGAETSERPAYVTPEAFEIKFRGSPKYEHIRRPRLVGRQCSYQGKARRLSWSLAPAGVVVANSCNYLYCEHVAPEIEDQVLAAMLSLLNSAVLEWYFRIFNSNNHVANYELDELPVCLDREPLVRMLAKQAGYLLDAYGPTPEGGKVASPLEDVLDACVAWGFDLTPAETSSIMDAVDPRRAARVCTVLEFILNDGGIGSFEGGEGWCQHSPPRLSPLDQLMLSHVPQGGNWQDIPDTVPSQRLVQIREMTARRGVVRTTYYGRLRPDQPAYTVATYYNRPGNGTNIHPYEDRTLTHREAARLQSFPDWYAFVGNDGSIRKQVGNAVPPLLGFSVGSHLKRHGLEGPCVDLFCGAGGLSLGLELAGWEVIAAADFDKMALRTYALNRPCEDVITSNRAATYVSSADLALEEARERLVVEIRTKLGGRELALLVGGPPCQGFSHAGWRAEVDQRNDLAIAYMKLVEALAPRAVVLENVEGLLTFDRGRVVRDLVATLKELGYRTAATPWFLHAEAYGVPQMRRRVFVVGSDRLALDPPPEFMQRCRGRREQGELTLLPDQLPYPFTVAEALDGLPSLSEPTHPHRGNRPVRGAFAEWAKGLLSTEALVDEIK